MKREELILGISLYALLIAVGFSKPLLKEIEKIPWNLPVYSFDRSLEHLPTSPLQVKVMKTASASRSPTLLPDRERKAMMERRDENWKRMASSPASLGRERERSHSLPVRFGRKTGSDAASPNHDPKGSPGAEPPKG